MKTDPATLKRVYAMSLAGVYPHYVAKAEKKGRTKAEVDGVIRWLTGYTQKQLESVLGEADEHRELHLQRQDESFPLTRHRCDLRCPRGRHRRPYYAGIRYLDKLIDELARGRPMEKILRKV